LEKRGKEGEREGGREGGRVLRRLTEDFEQLGNAVVVLRLVDKTEEDGADGLADEGPMGHEFPIDAMEDGFEVVALTRVFAVEQFDERGAEPVEGEGGREGGRESQDTRACAPWLPRQAHPYDTSPSFLPSLPPSLQPSLPPSLPPCLPHRWSTYFLAVFALTSVETTKRRKNSYTT